MIKGSWERGEAPGFWMEDDPPTGLYDSFIYDDTNDTSGYRYLLLKLLAKLEIIEHGTIYESTDCIRIRVKDA
jgi:hypothetical protein